MSELPRLCGELKGLLEAELAAGNGIRDVATVPGRPTSELVLLTKPFQTPKRDLPGVTWSLLNDPHWWHSQYACDEHHHVIACPFP